LDTTPLEPEEIARAFAEIQAAHAALVEEKAPERVSRYLGELVPELLRVLSEQDGPYLSPRTYARSLPQALLAIAAYYRVNGTVEPLRRAAVDALRYGVATKLQIKPVLIEQIHRATERLLSGGKVPPGERIKLEIAGLSTFDERMTYLDEHWKEIKAALRPDEIEKVLGELLRGASKKGEKEKLVALKDLLDRLGYRGDALRQVDGRLLIALNNAVNFASPRLTRMLARDPRDAAERRAFANIEAFQKLVAEGTFFARTTPEILALKTYLIDLQEGDQPADEASILAFFGDLDRIRA
jgi:hypothetical protein